MKKDIEAMTGKFQLGLYDLETDGQGAPEEVVAQWRDVARPLADLVALIARRRLSARFLDWRSRIRGKRWRFSG